MRRYILYDLLAAIVAGLCLCGLFTACGEDRGGDLPDDDPNSCLVTITLRASLPIRPPQTKAGEAISWENDDEYERDITDWLVVAYWRDIRPAKVPIIRMMIILARRWI